MANVEDGACVACVGLKENIQSIKTEVAVLQAVAPGQLARIEDSIRRIEADMAKQLEEIKKGLNTHGGKIERLEAWKYSMPLAGIAMLISVISGAVAIFR